MSYRKFGCSVTVASILAAVASPTFAQTDRVPSVPVRQISATGQQDFLAGRSGNLEFAGKMLALADFSGVLGMSSEMAYVVVVSGSVTEGNLRAGPGQMLLIPPYGGAVTRQHYDATRLLAGLTEGQRQAGSQITDRLARIAAAQQRGVFFGRLGRTRYNVAAPGSETAELAARSVKGSATVQAIRFAGDRDIASVERRVVDRFLAALATGDADSLAALMDPAPFGNADLRGGGGEARLLMARTLIEQRDWPAALMAVSVERDGNGNLWRLRSAAASGVLVLRPMGDFIFVRAIDMGGQL